MDLATKQAKFRRWQREQRAAKTQDCGDVTKMGDDNARQLDELKLMGAVIHEVIFGEGGPDSLLSMFGKETTLEGKPLLAWVAEKIRETEDHPHKLLGMIGVIKKRALNFSKSGGDTYEDCPADLYHHILAEFGFEKIFEAPFIHHQWETDYRTEGHPSVPNPDAEERVYEVFARPDGIIFHHQVGADGISYYSSLECQVAGGQAQIKPVSMIGAWCRNPQNTPDDTRYNNHLSIHTNTGLRDKMNRIFEAGGPCTPWITEQRDVASSFLSVPEDRERLAMAHGWNHRLQGPNVNHRQLMEESQALAEQQMQSMPLWVQQMTGFAELAPNVESTKDEKGR